MDTLPTLQKGALERRFLLVYIALFIPYSVMAPFLQQLLHLYGYRHDQIGYILGMLELMAVLAPPVWGLLSDRLRAPRALLLSAITLSIPTLYLIRPALSTPVALLAAAVFGFFMKPLIPLTDGITFAHFRAAQADYGHVRIGGSIAFIASVFCLEKFLHIGADTTGHLILATLTGAFLVEALSMAAIPSMKTPAAAKRPPFPWKRLLTPGFILFLTAAFLARFAMMSYYSFFSRYLNEVVGCSSVGYVWLLGPLSEFPLILCSGALIRRFGIRPLFLLALVGTALRLFGFAWGSSLATVLLLQPLHALTFGAYHVSGVSWVAKCFPVENQSSAQAIYSALTTGLGGVLGSAFAGVVLQHYGYMTMYMSCGAATLLALLLALIPARDAVGAASPDGTRASATP